MVTLVFSWRRRRVENGNTSPGEMTKNISRVWTFTSDSNANIEFNNTTQQWEVVDRKGTVRFIAKSRAACLEWEQQDLQPD